jgi:tRNA-2-methylthio-N6-dimethylallyladenosine synthase
MYEMKYGGILMPDVMDFVHRRLLACRSKQVYTTCLRPEMKAFMKTYAIQTMGCQMNERDSETIAGLLEQMGYIACAGREDADVIVVNTCSVRENADNRFFGLLGRIKHVKERRPGAVVAVCGCMMQQAHITDRIRDKHAWVDLIFGTHNIDALPEMIDEVLRERGAAEETRQAGKKAPAHLPSAFILQGRDDPAEGLPAKREFSYKASVNIMYGCDNFCTYCIVPYTRGREISRDAENILSEIRGLAASGVKEILLLGQNVNSYAGHGRHGAADRAGSSVDFADLIGMVDEVPGIERIRFMTSHPKDLSGKLIDIFRPAEKGGAKHLCPSVHLPVQSGSSSVLARMNRRYTKEDYLALTEKLRAARPDIVITTDFIVGFPGETDADFEDTMDVIERVRFDSAFTFLYSPRKGTPAAGYEEQVPQTVMRARFERMVERLNAIAIEKNRACIGGVYEALVEGASKTGASMLHGRTFGGKLINFPTPEADCGEREALTGKIVPVRVTSVQTFSLTGEIYNT